MSRALVTAALAAALGACVTLPGSESPSVSRYVLQGVAAECRMGGSRQLALSIVSVGPGLDTDRIARVDANTGEVTYLRDVRWIETAGVMLEQRMASDLECRGWTVSTGHYRSLDQAQLICELRALNLVSGTGGDKAEVGLSCLYYPGPGEQPKALGTTQSETVESWTTSGAIGALGDAYRRVMDELQFD